MCGIAGVIAWDEQFRVSRQTLLGMSARIAHRGPDGQGVWINHQDGAAAESPQAGLVHRRLAILDPDPRSNQPFTDGQRWLVFNGEIYNFRELRKEIDAIRPGYAWKTTGDTEVLLRAYDAWSAQCVDHLNGMFAFAIWDPAEKSLVLARDRMGQKPLYIAFARNADAPRAVAFASELAAILPVQWVDRRINPASLVEYLRLGYVPFDSIYKGVGQISPGTAFLITADRSTVRQYAPAWDDAGAVPGDAIEQTRRLVTQAVRRQLVSDVPLGCFLSGGVDSSIIAAAMKASVGKDQPVHTFSIGFDDPRYDETAYAAAVARHLGTEHHQFIVRPDAAEDLPKLAAVFGQPFGDSSALPTHYLARETRQHVKVALSGDGGDELFGGYDRYFALLLATRLRQFASPLPWMALAPAMHRWPGGHPKSAVARIKRFIASTALPPAERYASYMRLFDDRLLYRLLRQDKQDAFGRGCLGDSTEFKFRIARRSRGLVASALAVDRATYLPEDLLTKVDRASMLHALEVRSPFMDPDLVTFASGLSQSQLIGGGPKSMLRAAFADRLPASVFTRRKMGFAVPIGDWLRSSLRPMLHDLLFAADSFAAEHFNREMLDEMVRDHESKRQDHSQRLYALLMLELWWRDSRETRNAR